MRLRDLKEAYLLISFLVFVVACLSLGGCTIGPRYKTTYIVVEEAESGVLIIMNRKLIASVKYDGSDDKAPDAEPDPEAEVVEQNIAGYATMPRSHLRILMDELKFFRDKAVSILPEPVESFVEVFVD